jgi:hypothetical protein
MLSVDGLSWATAAPAKAKRAAKAKAAVRLVLAFMAMCS